MLNSPMNPELQALLDRISALEERDYIIEQTDNYTKYRDGTLIYHFTYSTGANTAGELQISFPGPKFINQSYTLSLTLFYTGNNWTSPVYVTRKYQPAFKVFKYSAVSAAIDIIAIGRWK